MSAPSGLHASVPPSAPGDVVNWLNSDDYYWGDALWTVGRAYAAHPGYGLYVGNGLRCDQRTGRHRYRAGGGNQAICAGAPLGWKVGCDEGDDGGQDQGGADALEK